MTHDSARLRSAILPAPRRAALGIVTTLLLALAACASDGGPADGALDEAQALDRLRSSCTDTRANLDALTPPADTAAQATWAGEVAAILDAQANDLRTVVVLDDDLRVDIRAFAENTGSQAAAWRQLGELLGSGAALDPTEVDELTTEIAELSLGRDDLSDELEVAECRRA